MTHKLVAHLREATDSADIIAVGVHGADAAGIFSVFSESDGAIYQKLLDLS